jgi:hypothetical protein
MSDGVLPCPYPNAPADDNVGTPGKLIDRGYLSVGGVDYKWYEWSDNCSLTGTAEPVDFDVRLWWQPTAGVFFTDVVGHPQTPGILASVRIDLPATGSVTTTTVNPAILNPTSGVEFRSPSANIHCEIDFDTADGRNVAFCSTSN